MILTKPTQAEAQELADRCHAYLIANDPAYAASVEAGQTTAWAVPQEVFALDADGKPTGPSLGWQVTIEPRVFGVLTAEEYTPPLETVL